MVDTMHKAAPEQAERLHRFAHDIRNRLTGLREVLRQLGQPAPDIDTAQLTTFGEQQFFKALREVESLLDDLRVERGVGPLNNATLDPAQLVERALADMRHRFAKKDQSVTTALASGLSINGDERCLTELIAALLSNASKFSPRGSEVQLTLESADGNAILRVQDHGVGLRAGDLEQLFVRYAWLHSLSTEGEAQGRSTLARAAQWAEAHGGTICAESAGVGQGCTFILTVPLG